MRLSLVALILVLTLPAGGAASEEEVASLHNAVVLPARMLSTPSLLEQENWPSSFLMHEVQGTHALLVVAELPLEGVYMLHAPDGSTVGPVDSFAGYALFPDAPLHKEGIWTVEGTSGVATFAFTTARYGAGAIADVLVDAPLRAADADYDAGFATTAPSCSMSGDDPTGYPLVPAHRATRVLLDVGSSPGDGLIVLSASGNVRSVSSVLFADDTTSARETLSVVSAWSTPGAYEITIRAFRAQEGTVNALATCGGIVVSRG